MLRRLDIRHLAIIESLTLDIHRGLSVLTGETGAGKSIIVGALNLVLGGRASSEVVRTGCEAAEVSALFDRPDDPDISRMLDEIGIAREERELLVRRQVHAEGRSRAWLNDRPVTVGALGDIAQRLVDISGQHQHQSLLRVENHLLLLDRYGNLDALRAGVGERYAHLRRMSDERRRLAEGIAQRQERSDFLRFQLDELKKAAVKPNEDEELNAERNLLRHAEAIREGLNEAHERLLSDGSVIAQCVRAERALDSVTRHFPGVEPLRLRLESARLELEDIAQSLMPMLRNVEADPQRLEEIESRLALLGRLLRKHGPTCTELLAKMNAMRSELEQLERGDYALEEMDRAIEQAARQTLVVAEELSRKRTDAARRLSAAIVTELKDLGMPKTRFLVAVEPRPEAGDETLSADGKAIGPTGIDLVEFRFSPNPGEDVKPLARIASGGELSRVMLAIKCVLLEHDPVAVSIFDEVDSGIGGVVAQKVGEKIRQLSGRRQVLCITHLPQIAAYGDHHLRVTKSSRQGRTFTQVERLDDAGAVVEELARMMTGEALGEASRQAAEELRRHATRDRRA